MTESSKNTLLPPISPIEHDIPDILYIAVDHKRDINQLVKFIDMADQLGMGGLRMSEDDYTSDARIFWLAGDARAVEMFSLKFKEHICVQMTQEDMNDALESVSAMIDNADHAPDLLDILTRVMSPGLAGAMYPWLKELFK